MNVAFLANSFHLKETKSADFFIALLGASFGQVKVIPHKEAWSELPKRRWNLIVVWQHRYRPEELEAFGAGSVVLVPMYDDTPLDEGFWRKYKSFKVFCFSSTLERLLVSYGLTAWGVRYYPDPQTLPATGWQRGLRGFFWPRTGAIDWLLVRRLVGNTPFERIHLHWTPSVHGDNSFPLTADIEKAGMQVEVSSWFTDADEYHTLLAKSNIFFASRLAEGIGMSFLEAMAMGLCVVAPRAPTMSEYIEDGVNGLLYDPDKPEALDFSHAEALGAAARSSCKVGSIFWQTAAPRIAAFLEDPAPGYVPRFHPVIVAKGRALGIARKTYRFMKRVAKRTLRS
jgi:glycosyltransferase involved in cell wall biosynthesis